MRWLLSLTMLAILTMPGLAQADLAKARFTRHTSEKGRYNILFPGTPEHQKKVTRGPDGRDLTMELDIVSVGKGSAMIVSFTDYPEQIKQHNMVEKLKEVRDGIKGGDGKLVADEELQFGPEKLPARKFQVKKTGGVSATSLILFHETRLYQIIVIGEEKVVHDKVVEEKFFPSFNLAK